jgi:hypothetical protein
VVEDLGLSGLSLGDQGLIQNVENILADLLQFGLDLLTVVTDGGNVLISALGFLFLLDRGDDAPGGTSCANNVLVGNREKVSLVNGKFPAQLCHAYQLSHRAAEYIRRMQVSHTLATSFMYVTISS